MLEKNSRHYADDLLAGRITMEQVPESLRCWTVFFASDTEVARGEGLRIGKLPTREERIRELNKFKEPLRGLIEKNARAIFEARRRTKEKKLNSHRSR